MASRATAAPKKLEHLENQGGREVGNDCRICKHHWQIRSKATLSKGCCRCNLLASLVKTMWQAVTHLPCLQRVRIKETVPVDAGGVH